MTDTEGIVIAKDEIKDALREKLDRDPTKEELNLFREFCVVDIRVGSAIMRRVS